MRAFVCALAMALSLAGGAQAQAWKSVIEVEGVRHDLDLGSVTTDGSYVTSTMRWVAGRLQKGGGPGESWTELRFQRIDDCENATFSLVSVASYDAEGVVVEQEDGSERPRTGPAKPGTAIGLYHDTVCAIADRRAAMKPAVPLPEAELSWTLLGQDEATRTDFFSLDDAVLDTGEGQVMAVVRQSPLITAALHTGEPYRHAISAFLVDCETGQYAILATDYYDRAGELIFTYTSPPELMKPSKGAPTSAVDVLWRNACAPGAAQQVHGRQPQGGMSSGTAWLGPKGYLVTASHVVAGADRFTLYQNGKPIGTAELVVDDPANDVAVLKPKLQGAPRRVLALAAGPAALGEPIVSLGYPAPDVLGLSIKATAGEVNAVSGVSEDQRTDPRLLQISAQTHSGNSGGPVVNRAGQVVGIVVTKMDLLGEQEVAQNVNYALKAGYVRSMLLELPDVGGHEGEWALSPDQNAAELLQGSVFLLVAEASGE